MRNIIKRLLNWIDNLDLGNPKAIPCNPNCINEGYVIVSSKKDAEAVRKAYKLGMKFGRKEMVEKIKDRVLDYAKRRTMPNGVWKEENFSIDISIILDIINQIINQTNPN